MHGNRRRALSTYASKVRETHRSGGIRRARGLIAIGLFVSLALVTGQQGAAAAPTCVPAPKAVLVQCNFDGMNLSGAQLADSDLTGDSFVGADLSDAHLTSAQFIGADLARANFTHATMAHVHMVRCNVTDTILGADLYRVYSEGLVGMPVQLPKGWMVVDDYLIGPSAKLPYAKLAKADLAAAHLADSYLFGADLAGADLSNARLIGSHLGRADLQGANLSHADARAAEFRFANLNGANLTGAVIQGSNLRSVSLVHAKLVGVVWRNDVCPDGTESKAAGNTCAGNLQLHGHPSGRQRA